MNSLQIKHHLPEGWHFARFDELLKRIERKVMLDDDAFYDCVGVRWYGLGAFVRERLLGMDISRKQQWIIKSGDIVYNKLFAWKGAFAIADNPVDGCIVSDKFPTYEANLAVIDPQFLRYYFRTTELAKQAQDLSKGAAAISKLTLNPPQFWDLAIPLPPLQEQHRIVARIEELAGKIEEARGLRREAVEEAEAFLSEAVTKVLNNDQWVKLTLGSLLREDSRNGLSVRPSDDPPGIPILRISAATSRRDAIIDEQDYKYIELNKQDINKYKIDPGDLLACRYNGNLHYVGKFALYEGHSGKTQVYPDKLIRFRLDTKKISPEFARYALNSTMARQSIEAFCATTAGNIGISASDLKTVLIPIPSGEEQSRIVTYLDDLHSKIDFLNQLQSETAAELDALLPSVLDKAFKGEL